MRKILVIDDDPTVQNVFGQYLRTAGYEVLVAGNGREGVALIRSEFPDLVITDILMPEMDGLEILLQIRNEKVGIPIIAISGGMRALPINFLHQAKLFGARHVFEKPVPLKVLHNAVTDLIGTAEADGGTC